MSIQARADQVCKERGIPPIPIICKVGGECAGHISWWHTKGSKIPHSKYIVINMPQWFADKNWDDVIYTLAHELAHHETCCKDGHLRHTAKHAKLTNTIAKRLAQYKH